MNGMELFGVSKIASTSMILGANEPSMEMMFPTYVEVFLRITGLHRIALNF